jgi:hypothetical protein
MGNSDELDAIQKHHEEELKRIQALTNDETKKEIEELDQRIICHLKIDDLENLAKKYH